eukprot:GHRR01027461.1.p1 GENE.GHRR01027461.1~~GHRR01027461.1.p1  ORF type:complete len:271 (+),score=75.01 GHRR01027461.1:661-1473(+)
MTQSYYQHVAATEGRMGELPPCQLLITRRKGDEVTMVPVTQADLEQGHASLPRESPVLSKIMSPASLTELHWSRVPAVVVFGCFAPDETELQQAAAAGVPVSPSMTGPHTEELKTQMEVFFKQYTYPENKCFILRDWGFLIFGSDLPEAIASFNEQLRETLDKTPSSTDAATGIATTPKSVHGILSTVFKKLQFHVGMLRTQSLPTDDGAEFGPKPMLTKTQSAEHGSQPSSPMIAVGTELPDSIRSISTAAPRGNSVRTPSFQTGFKPW